jgi:hypothetical protein
MFNWPTFATGIFGGSVSGLIVVYGVSRWLGDVWKSRILEKVQQENRRELEAMKLEMQASVDRANRLLDAGISKAILVTRTHFETEFAAYKEIFAALSEVKNYMHATRPVFVIAGEGESVKDEANLVDRLNKLVESHNKAVVISENLRPFYQEEIYEGTQKCINSSKFEILQVKTSGHKMFNAEWFEDGRKNQEVFSEHYIRVSTLIRVRLNSPGVLPN